MGTKDDRHDDGAPRVPLTRERVLRAALQMADEQGLKALGMRALARTMGVGAMSLYNHVSNKDDVIDGITDMVAAQFEVPCGADWRASLRASALSAHAVLLRHPWACTCMATRAGGPARLHYYDRILGTLREAGMSMRIARKGFVALDAHVIGFAQQEAAIPVDPQQRAAMAGAYRDSLPADDVPYMVEMLGELMDSGDYDYQFAFVLDLILDGLQRLADLEHTPT